ncbi:MAG: sigma-70 family RNA polymerase sigma factor [Acidobacteriia bacterium]|nr:sigma-70 family RNA polymerase sigma factor [Terriglobia bacterium]
MKTLKLQWADIGSQVMASSILRAESKDPGRDAQTMTDLERVERCLKGEREAFDELVRAYQRPIYRLCFRYSHHPEEAYDLAQDAFLKAYQGLRTFNRRSSFKTWLYRVAINNCINFLHRQRSHGEEVEVESAEDPSVRIDDRVEQDEQLLALRASVDKLPPRQQAALKLRVYDQLSYEEISKILKCTVSTAKTNVFFGLANLRKVMKVGAVHRGEKD